MEEFQTYTDFFYQTNYLSGLHEGYIKKWFRFIKDSHFIYIIIIHESGLAVNENVKVQFFVLLFWKCIYLPFHKAFISFISLHRKALEVNETITLPLSLLFIVEMSFYMYHRIIFIHLRIIWIVHVRHCQAFITS